MRCLLILHPPSNLEGNPFFINNSFDGRQIKRKSLQRLGSQKEVPYFLARYIKKAAKGKAVVHEVIDLISEDEQKLTEKTSSDIFVRML